MPDDPLVTNAEAVAVVGSGVWSGQSQAEVRLPGAGLLAAARARGQQMQRDILASQGELLDAEAVSARLGLRSDEVVVRSQDGRLIGLPCEGGAVGFPSWQFTHDGLLPGLEIVLDALGVRNTWMRAAFFLSGDIRLDGRTPLEALLNDEVEAVRRAAAAYGEQLAS